jgi:hypothetical protein
MIGYFSFRKKEPEQISVPAKIETNRPAQAFGVYFHLGGYQPNAFRLDCHIQWIRVADGPFQMNLSFPAPEEKDTASIEAK